MRFSQILGFTVLQLLLPGSWACIPAKRPVIEVSPKHLDTALPVYSPARNRSCTVIGGTQDDSAALLAALESCNNGGRVLLSSGVTYTIGTALDLTFLEHVDIGKRIDSMSKTTILTLKQRSRGS